MRAGPVYFKASSCPSISARAATRAARRAGCEVLCERMFSRCKLSACLARARSVRACSAWRLASSLTKPWPGATSGCCKTVAILSSKYFFLTLSLSQSVRPAFIVRFFCLAPSRKMITFTLVQGFCALLTFPQSHLRDEDTEFDRGVITLFPFLVRHCCEIP